VPQLPVTTASIDVEDADRMHSLRRELGVESFGINLMTLRPGQRNRVHIHKVQEEVYLVLAGELTLVVEGEDLVLGAGELVRVPPPVRRQLTNRGAAPVRLLALGGYGEHEPRDALAWTSWDEGGEGRLPKEVPLPEDLPVADA
jgi:uncharacterized cupin superfamily protein